MSSLNYPCTARLSLRQQEILVLQNTLQLEQGIFQLYDGVAQRLGDPDEIEAVTDFARDHHQHVIALRTRLALLGANVVAAGPATRLRGMGHRLISRVAAEPALLSALARQERMMHEHYRSVDMTPLSRASCALMHHSLCDEKGHHRWLDDRVASLRHRTALPLHAVARASTAHWAHARTY